MRKRKKQSLVGKIIQIKLNFLLNILIKERVRRRPGTVVKAKGQRTQITITSFKITMRATTPSLTTQSKKKKQGHPEVQCEECIGQKVGTLCVKIKSWSLTNNFLLSIDAIYNYFINYNQMENLIQDLQTFFSISF